MGRTIFYVLPSEKWCRQGSRARSSCKLLSQHFCLTYERDPLGDQQSVADGRQLEANECNVVLSGCSADTGLCSRYKMGWSVGPAQRTVRRRPSRGHTLMSSAVATRRLEGKGRAARPFVLDTAVSSSRGSQRARFTQVWHQLVFTVLRSRVPFPSLRDWTPVCQTGGRGRPHLPNP